MATTGYTEQGLPFTGTTSTARHASWTGARAAAANRKALTGRYIALVVERPHTDHEAAERLNAPLSSINSIRNGLGPCVAPVGEPQRMTRGGGTRATVRTRWGWVGPKDSTDHEREP